MSKSGIKDYPDPFYQLAVVESGPGGSLPRGAEFPSQYSGTPVLTTPALIDEWENYLDNQVVDGRNKGTYVDGTFLWNSKWYGRIVYMPIILGYDDFESYAADAVLNGLAGGDEWGGAAVAREVYNPGLLGGTDLTDATVSSDLNGQTLGDWANAFIAR